MPDRNALEIKEKMLYILRRRGPSLPVHVAKETGLSILFASAFLSELVADRKIKFSDMKVGSSPVYFLNEHAYMLEKFSQYLNSREKEAFLLLKEKKFLKDEEQPPVIRVALREIKDFAIPFNSNGKIIWRYYIIPESEFTPEIKIEVQAWEQTKQPKETEEETIIEIKEEKPLEIKITEVQKEIKETKKEEKEIDILDQSSIPHPAQKKEKKETKESKEAKEIKEKPKLKAKKKEKKKGSKTDENFFNKVKEWVLKNSMEILDIENFGKNELRLKVKTDGKEILLMAYNKKKFTDSDLIKAGKKAKEEGLNYMIISIGDTRKKLANLIDATRNLSDIRKIE